MATDCDGGEWKMCKFLRTYVGKILEMTYVGRMLPKLVTMSTNQRLRFDLGIAVAFYGTNAISTIKSRKGGDRLSFTANLFLTHTLDMFPGENHINKIYTIFHHVIHIE